MKIKISKPFRDMVYKGYIVVYKIVGKNKDLIIFGFTKYEEDLHM